MTIRIGQVSTRKGYRLHAINDLGRAQCGAGKGVILGGTERDLATDTVKLICKRCRKHLRNGVEAGLADATTASGNRYNPTRIATLTGLADAFKTTTELALDADLAARIVETITAAPVVQTLPERRRRTWADLRDDFATTHPQLPFAA